LRAVQAFKVGVVAFVLGAIGAVAVYLSPSWFPVAASEQAVRQDDIYMALMIMSSFIFSIVVCFLGYSMWKFRAKPGDMSDGEPIHGNTLLEIVWTIIPLVLVLGFATYGAFALSKNENTSDTKLVVNVTGSEFVWSFYYPATKVHSGILELPVNQKVLFKVNGVKTDVIHEFYIPAFREGIDAVPGVPTSLVATPTRLGTYAVICNMLCGIGHSQMRTVANVVTPDKFAAWIKLQQQPPKPPPSSGPVDAKALFSTNCASCHTLDAADAHGTIGPDLDHITADAAKYGGGASPEDYVHESIVDPDKVIVTGFHPNIMPATFSTSLSADQIDALVDLIVKGNGG
jgi:cytochrome c oxidase subunit II